VIRGQSIDEESNEAAARRGRWRQRTEVGVRRGRIAGEIPSGYCCATQAKTLSPARSRFFLGRPASLATGPISRFSDAISVKPEMCDIWHRGAMPRTTDFRSIYEASSLLPCPKDFGILFTLSHASSLVSFSSLSCRGSRVPTAEDLIGRTRVAASAISSGESRRNIVLQDRRPLYQSRRLVRHREYTLLLIDGGSWI
jgi:hypothetical protein